MENVPDELASEISRVRLLDFSSNSEIFKKLNKKKWKRQQVRWTQKEKYKKTHELRT